nr:unnamed protein product [Digitaria exilis]
MPGGHARAPASLRRPLVAAGARELPVAGAWGFREGCGNMHKLVPEEKAEVAKEDRLPMSQGLQMLLSSYGFDVKPEMFAFCIQVNEQIVKTASALFKCDAVDETFSTYLRDTSKRLKKISGINCENWSLLKLATALKVIFCPEGEKGDKFCKVLSKDELLKLKDEAHKYTNILSEMICLRAYNKIWVSRDPGTASEPIVLGKSTFCEGLSLGETGGKRIASISGAQLSTSKAIVPYRPFPHAVLLNSCAENQSHNIDVDNMDGHNINLVISTLPPFTESVEQLLVLGIEASVPLGSVGDSG